MHRLFSCVVKNMNFSKVHNTWEIGYFYVGFAQMCKNETSNQALTNMDKRTNQKACKKSRTSFDSTQSKENTL